jgi:hypothetical protein
MLIVHLGAATRRHRDWPRGDTFRLTIPKATATFNAEGVEKILVGVSIDGSAFVEKVSGSRPGRP